MIDITEKTDPLLILREYNRWRRGKSDRDMLPPALISHAIDAVCTELSRRRRQAKSGIRNSKFAIRNSP